MGHLRYLNQALKSYDSNLYVAEHKMGRFDVYRKSQFGTQPPHFLFSLTDSWKVDGTPVSYGAEVVLDRVKANDLWRDDTFVERWLKEHEKHLESQERARKNNMESFLYDFHAQFKKTMGDVNTSNLKKLYRDQDGLRKGNSNGYCEPRPR